MREMKMDNIRFVLIFLVALGHFCEFSANPVLKYATEFIYSFHMPVFVFVSGYFAKFNAKRVVRTYLYSSIMMQILYHFFLKYYLGYSGLVFQYSTPHYTLWYLFAMAVYTMIIPLIETERIGKKIATVFICFAIALLAGMDTGIGYSFATGRIFAFLPFFVLGFYCRGMGITEKLTKTKLQYKISCGAVIGVAVMALEIFIIKSPSIVFADMTFSYPYYQTAVGWKARAILLIAGLLWVALFLIVTPNKKIPVVSNIGANTFPIYVLHGFVVRILIKNGLVALSPKVYAVVAVALSFALLLMFGNKIASNISKWTLTGQWMNVVDKKEKTK